MSANTDMSAASAAKPTYSDGYSAVGAWWAVVVVMVFNIISLVDRMIIAVLIPEMRVALDLNDFQISLVQGMAFALFYGGMGLLIGGLVDRYSRRNIMAAGIVLWSAAAAATGLAKTYAQLFGARLMVGVGEGAISPAAQSLLSSIFPRGRLSLPMSCFVASGIAGMGVSFALGGYLLDYLTRNPLGGLLEGLEPWRQVLIITGIPGVVVALLAYTLREPHRGGTDEQKAAKAKAAGWGAFFAFLRSNFRVLGGLLICYCLTSMATSGTMVWGSTYARRVLEASATDVGFMMGISVTVGGITGTLLMGILVDRIFSRGVRDIALRFCMLSGLIIAPVVSLAFLGFDPGFSIGSFSGPLLVVLVAMTLMMLTMGASFGPSLAAIQMVAPVAMRGRFAALAVLLSNLGGMALGPMAIGALTDGVFDDPMMVGYSIMLVLVTCGLLAGLSVAWSRSAFRARVDELERH